MRKDQDLLSFEDARKFAQSLGLKTRDEWFGWSKSGIRPGSIPADPRDAYKENGWSGWGDWLGTGNTRYIRQNPDIEPSNRTQTSIGRASFLPFAEARGFVRSLGLSGSKEWQAWCKTPARPADIPTNPYLVYADEGWTSYADWLGTKSGQVRTFEQARDFTRSLGLKGSKEWFEWAKTNDRPSDIPASPRNAYKDAGWLNWADWLGTNNKTPGSVTFLPFEEARTFARSLGLKGTKEWNEWNRTGVRPANIPSAPYSVYADKGWLVHL
jgi:hypothetical protein